MHFHHIKLDSQRYCADALYIFLVLYRPILAAIYLYSIYTSIRVILGCICGLS